MDASERMSLPRAAKPQPVLPGREERPKLAVMFYEAVHFYCIKHNAADDAPPFGSKSLWKGSAYEKFTSNAIGYVTLQELFGDKETRRVLVPAKNGRFNLYEVSHLNCHRRYHPGKPFSRLCSAQVLMGDAYPFSEKYDWQARWATSFVDLEKIFSSTLERTVVMPWNTGETAIYNVRPIRPALRPTQIPTAAKLIDRNRDSTSSHRQQYIRKVQMKAEACENKENALNGMDRAK